MPMHCSANISKENPKQSAIFFGLSGTGKTTLSSDPDTILVGDENMAGLMMGFLILRAAVMLKP